MDSTTKFRKFLDDKGITDPVATVPLTEKKKTDGKLSYLEKLKLRDPYAYQKVISLQ